MAYITRELERKFLKLNDFFKVILVTGARQVGKTTMLKHLAGSDRTYVTMDNTMARDLAQSDPVLFFQTYKPPILIDEVQKAPELFEQIKIICDESDEKGLIWLTGSQQYNMMKRVRETLAGRIGILELYSLSAREKAGLVFDTDLDFSLATLQARQRKLPKNDVIQVFNHIWEGGIKIPHHSHADFCSTDTAGGLDNKKRRYAPRGGVAYRLFLWGFPKGATPPFGTRLCEAKCSVLYALSALP